MDLSYISGRTATCISITSYGCRTSVVSLRLCSIEQDKFARLEQPLLTADKKSATNVYSDGLTQVTAGQR